MFKKQRNLLVMTLLAIFLMTGCSLENALDFFGKEKIDPPVNVTLTDDPNELNETNTDATNEKELSVMTELYLIDKNGYVVPQTLALPETESVARQAVEYLVQNGPVQEFLPNGFRAVLPADTNVSIDVVEKIATVNLSNEFKNYALEDEMRILQSITWTLTQFDTIDGVKLKMNGHDLKQMPVGGSPIGEKYTRSNGINHQLEGVTNIRDAKQVTVYYLGGTEKNYYYVPVTKLVHLNDESIVEVVVNELVKGPYFTSSLQSDFMKNVALVDEPTIANGLVTLNFNEAILSNFEEKEVSDLMLNALVLSLTEQAGINTVSLMVNNESDIKTSTGQNVAEEVARPIKVNKQSY